MMMVKKPLSILVILMYLSLLMPLHLPLIWRISWLVFLLVMLPSLTANQFSMLTLPFSLRMPVTATIWLMMLYVLSMRSPMKSNSASIIMPWIGLTLLVLIIGLLT